MALAPTQSLVETPSRLFYRDAMEVLNRAKVPFLVGGAFAFIHQAGIDKSTKDLDIFARPSDVQRLLEACATAGYETELVFSHWLAKIRSPEGFIDVIFSSGNGLCTVDDGWFQHAVPAEILGVKVHIVPAEEMLWSKAFVMERNRYDGGDIAHLLQTRASAMDWARLLSRFNAHWRVLFSHVILFGFVYPAQRLRIPDWFMHEMVRRLELEMQSLPPDRRVCQGTLLSWSQYLVHLDRGEYEDARHLPRGKLTCEETQHMTDVLQQEDQEQP